MSDDVPPSRTARLIKAATDAAGKAELNPEDAELKELYGQLAEATVALREARKIAGEKPSSSADLKLRELDQQVGAIISRINKILG